jgi:hypothetical protein
MADVSTLIDRVERLRDGVPLPGDEDFHIGRFTRGFWAQNDADVRCGSLAVHAKKQPINRRLACELCDNVETILAALRYWEMSHASGVHSQPLASEGQHHDR